MADEKPLEQKKKPGAEFANALYWVLRQAVPPFLVLTGLILTILWVTIYTLKYLPPSFWQGSLGFVIGVLSFGATVVLLFVLWTIAHGVRPAWIYFRAKYIDKQPLLLFLDAANRARFVIPEMDPASGALTFMDAKVKKAFSSVSEFRFAFYDVSLFLCSAFHDSVVHPAQMATSEVTAKEADIPIGEGRIVMEGIKVGNSNPAAYALITHSYLKTLLDAVVNPAARDIFVKNEIQRQRAGEKTSFMDGPGKYMVLGMAFVMVTVGIIILWNAGVLRGESWCAVKPAGQAAASGGGFKLPALPGLGL